MRRVHFAGRLGGRYGSFLIAFGLLSLSTLANGCSGGGVKNDAGVDVRGTSAGGSVGTGGGIGTGGQAGGNTGGRTGSGGESAGSGGAGGQGTGGIGAGGAGTGGLGRGGGSSTGGVGIGGGAGTSTGGVGTGSGGRGGSGGMGTGGARDAGADGPADAAETICAGLAELSLGGVMWREQPEGTNTWVERAPAAGVTSRLTINLTNLATTNFTRYPTVTLTTTNSAATFNPAPVVLFALLAGQSAPLDWYVTFGSSLASGTKIPFHAALSANQGDLQCPGAPAIDFNVTLQ